MKVRWQGRKKTDASPLINVNAELVRMLRRGGGNKGVNRIGCRPSRAKHHIPCQVRDWKNRRVVCRLGKVTATVRQKCQVRIERVAQ